MDDLDKGLGTLIKGTDRVTGEEFVDVLTQHFDQPIDKLIKYTYSIVDFTEATYVTITLDDVKIIAQKSLENAKINPGVTVAIVTGEDVSSILAELWQLFLNLSSWNIKIFNNKEELEPWLKESLLKKHPEHQYTFA